MSLQQQELVPCKCGCGNYPNPGKKYMADHNLIGESNSFWKGDNVGRTALHAYVRRHLPEPKLCQDCNKVPSKDLANITGIYSREFKNWRYLCRKCHGKIDKVIDMSDRKCSICKSNKTWIYPKSVRPNWRYSKLTGEILCVKCYTKEYNSENRDKRNACSRKSRLKYREKYNESLRKRRHEKKRNGGIIK